MKNYIFDKMYEDYNVFSIVYTYKDIVTLTLIFFFTKFFSRLLFFISMNVFMVMTTIRSVIKLDL